MQIFNPLEDLNVKTAPISKVISPFSAWTESKIQSYTAKMSLLTIGDLVDMSKRLKNLSPVEAMYQSKVLTVAMSLQEINGKPIVTDELLEQYNEENSKRGFDKIGAFEFKVKFILKFTEQVLERFVIGYDSIQMEYLSSLIGEVPDELKIDLGELDETKQRDTNEISG
jgi:hypothetical protein